MVKRSIAGLIRCRFFLGGNERWGTTLTLQTYAEEKRARVLQMWLRTVLVRTKRTSPYGEILAEASTAADGVLWREPGDFCRCGSVTLGLELLRTASAGRGVGETQLAALLLLHPVSQNLALLFIQDLDGFLYLPERIFFASP